MSANRARIPLPLARPSNRLRSTTMGILLLLSGPHALCEEAPPNAAAKPTTESSISGKRTSAADDREISEVRSELAATSRQLSDARQANRDLSERLTQLENRVEQKQNEILTLEKTLEALEAEKTRLTETNLQQARQIAALETTAGEQKEELIGASRETSRLQDRIEDAQRERQQLASKVSDLESRIESLQADNQKLRDTREALRQQVDALRAHLPEIDGGSATAERLQSEAAKAVEHLREQARRLQAKPGDPALSAAYAEAVEDLAARQLKLVRASGARGLYRVRSGDTLTQISKFNYGDPAQWQRIFRANGHVIDNPDRLLPDTTLMIP